VARPPVDGAAEKLKGRKAALVLVAVGVAASPDGRTWTFSEQFRCGMKSRKAVFRPDPAIDRPTQHQQ
jgi:hypothetical protein